MKFKKFILFSAFYFFLSAIGIGVYLYIKPNTEEIDLFQKKQNPVIINGKILDSESFITNRTSYLSFDTVKSFIDEFLYFDANNNAIILTTQTDIYYFEQNKTSALKNGEPISLDYYILSHNGQIYIPIQLIEDFYPVKATYYPNTNSTVLELLTEKKTIGYINKLENWFGEETKKPIRLDNNEKSPIVSFISSFEKIIILEEYDEYYFIQKENGIFGFILKEWVSKKESISAVKLNESVTKHNSNQPIHITWEAVYNRNPSTEKIKPMSGVHVVSPTWLHLENINGDIENKSDISYVRWAKKHNYKIWALFSNSFDPDLTHDFLINFNARNHAIEQLLFLSKAYEYDGINIDFENVYLKDKTHLVQFVRELSTHMRKHDLTLSIDITFKSGSENWSLFLDREALSKSVDYMIVMAYDEHWATSPVAGSVSSLPWVEKGIIELLNEIPNHKLILGIPFYMRLWETDSNQNVTSNVLSMKNLDEWLIKNNLTPTFDANSGQDYISYNKNDSFYQIWLENETSIKKRLELVRKYNLAGIATWTRGFASDDIWEFIEREL